FHQTCYVPANGGLNFSWSSQNRGVDEFINFYSEINFIYMNNAVAMRARNLWIYLRHHLFCRLYCGKGNIYRKSQRAKPVFVRRRNLNKRHIERKNISSKKPMHLAQKHWNIIA